MVSHLELAASLTQTEGTLLKNVARSDDVTTKTMTINALHILHSHYILFHVLKLAKSL